MKTSFLPISLVDLRSQKAMCKYFFKFITSFTNARIQNHYENGVFTDVTILKIYIFILYVCVCTGINIMCTTCMEEP